MNKQNGITFVTDELSKFKLIDGNRTDAELRAKNIAKSVERAGYIPAPIIVNEKYEIIDGQARFTYCKQTKTPITYLVINGLTIDDCIAMNTSTTRWSLNDFIASYAERGWTDYVILNEFLQANESKYGFQACVWALAGTTASNSNEKIKNGEFALKSGAAHRAEEFASYWDWFKDIKTNSKGSFFKALGYCYLIKDVDKDRLIRKTHQFPRAFLKLSSVTDAIDVFEDVYNDRNRGEHLYLETEYFKYLDSLIDGGSASILAKRAKRFN